MSFVGATGRLHSCANADVNHYTGIYDVVIGLGYILKWRTTTRGFVGLDGNPSISESDFSITEYQYASR